MSIIYRAQQKFSGTAGHQPAPALELARTERRTDAQPASGNVISEPLSPGTVYRGEKIKLDHVQLAARGFINSTAPSSHLSEEMRLLKRRLMQDTGQFGPQWEQSRPSDRLLMITSSIVGEGKSFTALNLALSLTIDKDRDVLLVDADVGSPSIFEMLGIDRRKGFIDLLRDPSLDIADLLVLDTELRLSLLDSGSLSTSVTELFSSQRVGQFVGEIANRYPDHLIIFDAPPVLATTGPLFLSHVMGRVLLIVESNRTSRQAVKAALDLLEPCDNVALVLNKMSGIFGSEEFGYGAGVKKYQSRLENH